MPSRRGAHFNLINIMEAPIIPINRLTTTIIYLSTGVIFDLYFILLFTGIQRGVKVVKSINKCKFCTVNCGFLSLI